MSSSAKYSLRLTCVLLLLVTSLWSTAISAADQKAWNYMPSRHTGVANFQATNPTWDGRGVVVAILDTGVDAFMPGMLETSTGQTKLIAVRDFSTEGNWKTVLAELDDSGTAEMPVYKTESGLLLRGANSLPVPPISGDDVQHPVYIGVISERQFVNNADVYDLNDDGDTSDQFGFLVYAANRDAVESALGLGRGYLMLQDLNDTASQTVAAERQSEQVWVVVVDTDGNGDLAGEVMLRDYHVNYDAFSLGSDNSPDSRSLMAWEVNIVANEDYLGKPLAPTAEFHFDDGSHGSHCAGIAAGFEVSGQAGMHGGAPGAWVMSLKLGDNRLAGGATRTSSMKKAYEFAAEFEEKWGIPVVINMSFGIGSVEEGDDSIGTWLNDLMADNPTLYGCTSAGNEGPGISTVGIPATSYSLLTSGASLSVETGRDLYNARMTRDTLFGFSSRGGETAKPDIVSPGSALSTVPGFVDGSARFNGTSMASPQTAGVVACLVGAAALENLDVHWGMVKRAVIAGGTPLAGQGLLDQGGGLVNVETSWKLLRKLAGSKTAKQVLWYDIETANVFQADGVSDAAYWRTPGGTPEKSETVTFRVRPVFHPDLSPDEKDTFFRSFSFKSDADWLKVVSGDRYIRGDMAMSVVCRYDIDKLQEPGAYSGRIIANLDGGDLGGLPGREFYLWNTVIVGEPVGPATGYTKVFKGQDLAQSSVKRFYVNVPAGATAMRVRLEVSEDVGAKDGAAAYAEICNPQGHVKGGYAGYARCSGDNIRDQVILADELYPGIWEINVVGGITSLELTDFQLTVSFDGYAVKPEKVTSLKRSAAGKDASGSITVTRAFAGVFRGSVTTEIEGFSKKEEVEVKEKDEWTHSFTLDKTTPRASFYLLMDKAVANLFTDCAVNILDSSGAAVNSTGFDGVEVELGYTLPASAETGTYTLQVVGAFALAEEMEKWAFEMEEKYFLASPVSGSVTRSGGGRRTNLYCGVPTELDLSFSSEWPAAPAGLSTFGKVKFRDTNTDDRRPGDDSGRLVLEIPIVLE